MRVNSKCQICIPQCMPKCGSRTDGRSADWMRVRGFSALKAHIHNTQRERSREYKRKILLNVNIKCLTHFFRLLTADLTVNRLTSLHSSAEQTSELLD